MRCAYPKGTADAILSEIAFPMVAYATANTRGPMPCFSLSSFATTPSACIFGKLMLTSISTMWLLRAPRFSRVALYVPSALWLVNAENKEAAQAIIEGDPFFKLGLRQSVDIYHWSKGVWSEPFAQCMSALEGT